MPKNLKQTSCKILIICDCNAHERANRKHLYWLKNKNNLRHAVIQREMLWLKTNMHSLK